MPSTKKYDVAFSFAGEDRQFVEQVADYLLANGIEVFYDKYVEETLWGKHLPETLDQIYRSQSRFVVVFISKAYAVKVWTRHEIRSVLSTAINNSTPYMLPVRFDDTDLPGVQPTIAYIDLRNETPDSFAEKILNKIGDNLGKQKVNIVLDESYGDWAPPLPNTVGYSNVIDFISDFAKVTSNDSGYSSGANLATNEILVLPLRRRKDIEENDINAILDWVYKGGALLAMGLYEAEIHHENNINKLLSRFGFEFENNLMMPAERFVNLPIGKNVPLEEFTYCRSQTFEINNRDYYILSKLNGQPESHFLLTNVSELILIGSCTIECHNENEFDLIVSTSEPVAILHAIGYKDSSGNLARIDNYVLDRCTPGQFMVARAYGAGRVVGIGSWKIFLNELSYSNDGNKKFFRNIIEWLKKADQISK